MAKPELNFTKPLSIFYFFLMQVEEETLQTLIDPAACTEKSTAIYMSDKISYGGYGTGHAGFSSTTSSTSPMKGSSSIPSVGDVGLRILTQISTQGKKSNIVVKSALRLRQRLPTTTTHISNCFLKTCHLCNKGLSLDKEVYMYRGDLGFCSIECRNRQIVVDEMRELEASTKQAIASYRRQYYCTKSRQQHHKPIPKSHHTKIFAL